MQIGYKLTSYIAFIRVARALRITSQSLNPGPKGRSANGPVLKGRPQTWILIVTQKKYAKFSKSKIAFSAKHLRNRCASSMQNICKWYAKDMFVQCFCMFFWGVIWVSIWVGLSLRCRAVGLSVGFAVVMALVGGSQPGVKGYY